MHPFLQECGFMAKDTFLMLSQQDFPSNARDDSLVQRQIEQRLGDWLRISRYAYAPNTLKAYKQDWAIFFTWCFEFTDLTGKPSPKQSLPASPDTIIAFIQSQIGYRAPASLRRCLSSISKIHSAAGVNNPLGDEFVNTAKKEIGRGLVRSLHKNRPHHNLGSEQRQAKGLTWSHLLRIKELLPVSPLKERQDLTVRQATTARRQNGIWLKNARDRALIHLAYDSLIRVCEIVTLTLDDLDVQADGTALLQIRERKDPREGEIAKAYLAPDTVKEIQRWLAMSTIISGPLFCSVTKSGNIRKDEYTGVQRPLREPNVLDLFKRTANRIGERSALFSCHSTRVGATQDMLEENIDMLAVKQAGRWKSDRMPSRYAKGVEARRDGMAQLSMKKNRG